MMNYLMELTYCNQAGCMRFAVRTECHHSGLEYFPSCVLRLFGMDLNKMTHRSLAALRVTKPYLDIGC